MSEVMKPLTMEEKRELIDIARESIRGVVTRTAPPTRSYSSGRLAQPGAAFVTLKIDEALRGCIGSLEAVAPLHEAVASAAASAASRDPRFTPLSQSEFPAISLEISVLTPRRKVESVEDIVPGRDGLIVRMGMRSGLLLPQVATEYGWDRDEFLRHTCMKAGLPPDAWKDERCVIEAFSAEVFAESDLAA